MEKEYLIHFKFMNYQIVSVTNNFDNDRNELVSLICSYIESHSNLYPEHDYEIFKKAISSFSNVKDVIDLYNSIFNEHGIVEIYKIDKKLV